MSYLERTLSWFLRNQIFGGLKKLKQKEYLPFALLVLLIMSLNTSLAILVRGTDGVTRSTTLTLS